MTPDDNCILATTELTRSYGDVSVLEELSLCIDRGGVTALIGPNGSGKTTLLRTLAGLDEPTGGSVSYRGPEAVRPIGYLPQHPAFRPGQTVRDTLSFYADLVGESDERALSRLHQVGLSGAVERNVDALSGGMTRLLGIAQATVGDPPVVVFDEPASGLDPAMRVHVFDIVARLAADGTAVLLSSHDLSLVERTADRVILLDGGAVVHDGSVAALRERRGASSLLDAFEASIAAEAGTVRVQGETRDTQGETNGVQSETRGTQGETS